MRFLFFLQIVIPVLILGAFVVGVPQAMAQNSAPAPEMTAEKSEAPEVKKKIPEAYFIEADQYFDYCINNSKLNRHYNCECLATAYLDKRISSGPERSRSSIMLGLQKQCQDGTEATGYHFSQCMGQLALLNPPINGELYCGCFANTIAETYETYGFLPGSRQEQSVKTSSYVQCRDPDYAARMYTLQKK